MDKKVFSWRVYLFLSVLQFLAVVIKIVGIFLFSWWLVFIPLYVILLLFGIEFLVLYYEDKKNC